MENQFTAFGQELTFENKHWLETYSELFRMLAVVPFDDLIPFADLYANDNQSHQIIDKFLQKHAIKLEGYTLRTVADWLIWFSQDTIDKRKIMLIDLKQKELKRVKKELAELEKL